MMANCVMNIRTKNYQNQVIGFQVTVENVGDVFFETQCITPAQRATSCYSARSKSKRLQTEHLIV